MICRFLLHRQNYNLPQFIDSKNVRNHIRNQSNFSSSIPKFNNINPPNSNQMTNFQFAHDSEVPIKVYNKAITTLHRPKITTEWFTPFASISLLLEVRIGNYPGRVGRSWCFWRRSVATIRRLFETVNLTLRPVIWAQENGWRSLVMHSSV